MKRTFAALSVLSVAFAITVAAFGQTPLATQPRPGHLTRQQLNTLIATAKTPAEHERIARFYEAQAQDYRAQEQEHKAMVAAYKANSTLSTDKTHASTISHCVHFAQSFQALADNSQELATLHQRMAEEAPVRSAPTGK
jgi:hypothetical protein